MSGGWSPVVHLHAQSGGRPHFDDAKACFVPGTAVQAERSAGAANGSFALGACLAEGVAAGAEAARLAGFSARDRVVRRRPSTTSSEEPLVAAVGRAVAARHRPRAEAVRRPAERRRRVRHRARRARGLPLDRARQALHRAGLRHRPGQARQHQRHGDPRAGARPRHPEHRHDDVPSQLHAGHVRRDRGPRSRRPVRARSARPRCTRGTRSTARCSRTSASGSGRGTSRKPGEDLHAAVARECLAARNGVGIMDASTLGKIDIQGPDAATLLDWVYTNAWSQARRRPLPLRPDARRERHGDGRRRHDAPRRASLPDDHHHGRRGARDGVARALAADRMAAPRRSTSRR